MKELEKKIEKNKKIFKITLAVVVILFLLLFLSRGYGDYTKITLRKNNKTIFSISDLIVNNLKYGSTEDEILDELGTPIKEKKIEQNNYSYKELSYNGLKVTLKENYDDYILSKVEITSRKYKISRKIKLGNSIDKVMKKFKIENKKGNYLYGNYSTDALLSDEIKDNIYFGLRTEKQIIYVNRDSRINDLKSNIAKLNIYYKNGKVTKIIWSYDFE